MEKEPVYLVYSTRPDECRLFSSMEEANKYSSGLKWVLVHELKVHKTALEVFQEDYNEQLKDLNKKYGEKHDGIKQLTPETD